MVPSTANWLIRELNKTQIAELESKGELSISVDSTDLTISADDVEIVSNQIEGWVVETEEGVTVALDTELDEMLIAEGYAREFVNRVQNMRKDADFDVVDRINVYYKSETKLKEYIDKFAEYISNEILAENLFYDETSEGFKQEWQIGDFDCTIVIKKAKK